MNKGVKETWIPQLSVKLYCAICKRVTRHLVGEVGADTTFLITRLRCALCNTHLYTAFRALPLRATVLLGKLSLTERHRGEG